jgi:hypothetical protein
MGFKPLLESLRNFMFRKSHVTTVAIFNPYGNPWFSCPAKLIPPQTTALSAIMELYEIAGVSGFHAVCSLHEITLDV